MAASLDTTTDTADKLACIELINKVFVYVDDNNFDGLSKEVFADKVDTDFVSLWGGKPIPNRSKDDLINEWRILSAFDYTMHCISNHIITFKDDQVIDDNTVCRVSHAKYYGIAEHYLSNSMGDNTWSCGGSYDTILIKLTSTKEWKVRSHKFNVKWKKGNMNLFTLASEKLKTDNDNNEDAKEK